MRTIYQQSVFDRWTIADNSVQSVITSPPYYALRKYDIPDVVICGDSRCVHEWGEQVIERKRVSALGNHGSVCMKCNAWKGQYGLEPTPQMYVEHTRLWAKETWRVLRDDGVFFLNIADTYAGSGGAGGDYNSGGLREGQTKYKQAKNNFRQKCQLLIPHRVAIALIDDGWVLRNTIIWQKPNAMPESVTDRFSKKYEYIFMFVKSGRYYFDLDVVREVILTKNRGGIRKEYKSKFNNNIEAKNQSNLSKIRQLKRSMGLPEGHINGKNPGDIWQIPTQPSSEKHYAMWPERLVERMVRCSTKAGDTVLDPFAGSGTTLKVAMELGRKAIGIDLGYRDIQESRLAIIQRRLG